jgi:hypothetical protein
MKKKSVRLALVGFVAVLSVFGLSTAPADAGKVQNSRITGGWCC